MPQRIESLASTKRNRRRRRRIEFGETLESRECLAMVPYAEGVSLLPIDLDRPTSVAAVELSPATSREWIIDAADGLQVVRAEPSQPFFARFKVPDAHAPQLADLNADQALDLIALRDDMPYLWLNNGQGDWESPQPIAFPRDFPLANRVDQVELADADADGDLDLLLVAHTVAPVGTTIGWLINSPSTEPLPQFSSYREIVSLAGLTYANQIEVLAADLDHSGTVDVITQHDGEMILYRETNGVSTPQLITPRSTFVSNGRLQAVDVDGIAGVELVVAARHYKLHGVETLVFGWDAESKTLVLRPEYADVGRGAERWSVGDIDHDGDQDIVRQVGTSIEVVRQANGRFVGDALAISSNEASPPTDFLLQDVELDGDDDVVLVSAMGDRLSWYENLGGNTPFVEHRVTERSFSAISDVRVVDLNGDSFDDLVLVGPQLSWLPGAAPDIHFAPPSYVLLNALIADFAIADVDQDGDLDLAIASLERTLWLEQTSPGSFTEHQLGGPAYSIAAADLDDDGDVDLLTSDLQTPWDLIATFYRHDQGAEQWDWTASTMSLASFIPNLIVLEGGWYFVEWYGHAQVANGHNGRSRVILPFHRLGIESVGTLSVEVNDESRLVGTVVQDVFADDVHFWYTVTDVNGDARDDIVVSYADDVEFMAWYDLPPGQAAIEHLLPHLDTIVGSADVDDDGDRDLLLGDSWGENIDGRLTDYTRHERPAGNAIVADLDDDQRPDLVTYWSDRVYWYRNESDLYDWNNDHHFDAQDVDQLVASFGRPVLNGRFDVDHNQTIDGRDLDTLLRDRCRSSRFDTTLDGSFDSSDLIALFQTSKYDTGEFAFWSDGDWDGDGRFDSNDLVLAWQEGNYVTGLPFDDD